MRRNRRHGGVLRRSRTAAAFLVLAASPAAPQGDARAEERAPAPIVPMSAAAPAVSAPSGLLGPARSGAAAKPKDFEFRFGFHPAEGEAGRASAGASGGLAEGKPLEAMVWGGSGAVAGALAGPLGAAVGGAVGAACGLLYSIFVVPHNGPEARPTRPP